MASNPAIEKLVGVSVNAVRKALDKLGHKEAKVVVVTVTGNGPICGATMEDLDKELRAVLAFREEHIIVTREVDCD